MNIENRLTKLEGAAAAIFPPDGARLCERMAQIPDEQHKAWLASLSDEELTALFTEADRQWIAGGYPPIDFKQFSDAELDRILEMSEAQCTRILCGDFSELRGGHQ